MMVFIANGPIDPSSLIQYFISLLMLTLFFFLSRSERRRRQELKKMPEEPEEDWNDDLDQEEEDEEDEDFWEEEEKIKPLPQVLPLKPPAFLKRPPLQSKIENRKFETSIEERKLKNELEALYGASNWSDIEKPYKAHEGDNKTRGRQALKSLNHLTEFIVASEVIGKPRGLYPHEK